LKDCFSLDWIKEIVDKQEPTSRHFAWLTVASFTARDTAPDLFSLLHSNSRILFLQSTTEQTDPNIQIKTQIGRIFLIAIIFLGFSIFFR
jgi:hypothetical protein